MINSSQFPTQIIAYILESFLEFRVFNQVNQLVVRFWASTAPDYHLFTAVRHHFSEYSLVGEG